MSKFIPVLAVIFSLSSAFGVMAQDGGCYGLEADVYPWFADAQGDGIITAEDCVLIGHFAAGLDTPVDPCQFAAADCAPRSSLGDGVISTTDVVQAFRYAFAFDSWQEAGGPTNAIYTPRLPGLGPRAVFVDAGNIVRGQDGTATVFLDAAGDEVAVGFSVVFDPTQLQYKSFTSGVSPDIIANTNQAANGYLGFIVLSFNAPYSPFSADNNALVHVVFTGIAMTNTTAAITLGNTPVSCEISSMDADPLEGDFDGTSVMLSGPAYFTYMYWSNQKFYATFNSDPGSVYTIESSSDLATWKSLLTLTNQSGHVTWLDGFGLPAACSNQFYRAVLVP